MWVKCAGEGLTKGVKLMSHLKINKNNMLCELFNPAWWGWAVLLNDFEPYEPPNYSSSVL